VRVEIDEAAAIVARAVSSARDPSTGRAMGHPAQPARRSESRQRRRADGHLGRPACSAQREPLK
jgi:hypothetical protein